MEPAAQLPALVLRFGHLGWYCGWGFGESGSGIKTQGDNFSHIRYFAQNIEWIKRKVAGPFIFIVLKRKTANLELGLSHLKKNPWRKSS